MAVPSAVQVTGEESQPTDEKANETSQPHGGIRTKVLPPRAFRLHSLHNENDNCSGRTAASQGRKPLGAGRRQRIEAYLERLFGYAVSLTQDRDKARDLVQDCALKALSAAREPRDDPAYRAWLFRILRNTFVDSQRKHGELLLDDTPEGVGESPSDPHLGDRHMIDVLTVRLGMAKLSPAHREIIALVDLGGLTYGEAADVLNIAHGTVMSRLARARQALLLVIRDGNVTPLARDRRARNQAAETKRGRR
jgi:RNA polymerase sigma-70 factor (ECF subfamily)